MTDQNQPTVQELLTISPDAVAMWLLRRLKLIDDGNRGRNIFGVLLGELFPGTGNIGQPVQLNQFGIPSGASAQREQMKCRLEDAYSLLMSPNWITADPSAGGNFCRLTDEGNRQLALATWRMHAPCC